jgi:hypothetical protein
MIVALAIFVASVRAIAYGSEQWSHVNKGVGAALLMAFAVVGGPANVAGYGAVAGLAGFIVTFLYGIRAYFDNYPE